MTKYKYSFTPFFKEYLVNRFDEVKDAAKCFGMSHQYFHRIANDEQNPSSSVIARILKNTEFTFEKIWEIK